MIYTKVELTPGVILKLNIDQDELYAVCPGCGIEHNLDYDLAFSIEDWSSQISCGNDKCNQMDHRMIQGEVKQNASKNEIR